MENDNLNIDSAELVNEAMESKRPKKKHRLLKILASSIILLVAIVIILGFVFPGLLWTKDLGVRYTEADYQNVLAKLNYIKDNVPSGSSQDDYVYSYGKTSKISTEFTSAEITAFINTGRPDYYAVKNAQVRINGDGTIDASGSVNVDYFLSEVLSGKINREQIIKEIPALGILPGYVNLALNVKGSIINNQASIALNSAEVQGIPIPSDYINSNEAISTLTTGINNMMADYKQTSGSVFEKFTVEDEKFVIQGEFPTSLNRTKK